MTQKPSLVPALIWLRHYPKEWLRPDLVAGLAAAAVVVPKAIAFATIAGLPVEVGLYTCLVPMVVYALFGTSRPLSVSTTTTISILTAPAIAAVSPDGSQAALITAAITLAALVGAVLIVARVLRLGFIANLISEPVLAGFKSGIGIVIVLDQIPKLLGVHIDKGGFLQDVLGIIQHVPQTSIPTLLVSIGVLVVIGVLEKFAPRLPIPLIAAGAAIAASALLDLHARGVGIVGSVPSGLPTLHWPAVSLLEPLWPAATGIALMSFTESIAASRAFATPDEPLPAANQELLALGLANFAGAFFGAMPAGGGTTQTAVNRHAGARSQLAELVTAAATLLIVLFVAPLIGLMPQAALGAIVIAYSVSLIKAREFLEIRGVNTREFRWALVALIGVVSLGTLKGILVAVIVSLLALCYQACNPPVYALARKRGTTVFRPLSAEHGDDEQWPGLLMVRIEGRLFFANARRVGELLEPLIRNAKPRVILIDCRAVIDLEYSALKALAEAESRLRREATELWLAGLNSSVHAVLSRSKLGAALGPDRVFLNMQSAVERYEQLQHPGATPYPQNFNASG